MARRDIVAYRLPAELAEILGPAPLLETEDPEAFNKLLAALVDALKPRNGVEIVLLESVVYLAWDARRLRRCKDETIDQGRRAASPKKGWRIEDDPLYPAVLAWEAAADKIDGVPPKPARVEPPPPEPEPPLGPVSDGLRKNLESIERMDKLLSSDERRLNQALAALESYRTSPALHPREVSEHIIEGEFDETSTKLTHDGATDSDGNFSTKD